MSSASPLLMLQDFDLARWHGKNFPGAPNAAVALKLGEEVGELMRAVNLIEHGRDLSGRTGDMDNLRMEIGDVAFCLRVLCMRYGLSFERVAFDEAERVLQREVPS